VGSARWDQDGGAVGGINKHGAPANIKSPVAVQHRADSRFVIGEIEGREGDIVNALRCAHGMPPGYRLVEGRRCGGWDTLVIRGALDL